MRYIYRLAMLLGVMMATGCNGDIFSDEPALPYDTDVTVEGDGGVAVVNIPLKDLEYITLYRYATQHDCTYYNAAGEEIPSNSPASEVSMIVYESDFNRYEIHKQGSQLIIKSICSTFRYDNHDEIYLEYSYGNRYINVTILPGKPLKLDSVEYSGVLMSDDEAQTKTVSKIFFENTSSVDISGTEYPFLNDQPYVFIDALANSWANDIPLTLDVLMYENGKWVFREKSDVRPGYKSYYRGPDPMTEVHYSVPATSKGYIITEVTYAGAEMSGTLYYRNEILDRTIPVGFNMSSYYPVSYDIRIEETH